jgi:hypothetical protein
MSVYEGSFQLPVRNELTEPMLSYLQVRGYEPSIKKVGEFDFFLTTNNPLDEDTFDRISKSPHTTAFQQVK